MRILLALLALLTGLTLPEVALATSRTEVAGSGVSAPVSAQSFEQRTECAASIIALNRQPAALPRKTIWLPTLALTDAIGIELSDRPRE